MGSLRVTVEVAGLGAGGQLQGLPAQGGLGLLKVHSVGPIGACEPLDLVGDGGG